MNKQRLFALKVVAVSLVFIPINLLALRLLGEPITLTTILIVVASFVIADSLLIVFGEKIFKKSKKNPEIQ